MPVPKPKQGEKQEQFISRCMGDKIMSKEYNQKQRAGICYSSWKSSLKNNSIIITNRVNNYTIRYASLNGKQYAIVPVIMSIPGVHSGSNGPTLYTEEVLSNLVEAWNGSPVVLNHPQDKDGTFISANSPEITNKSSIGVIYNTKYDGGLRSEAWIDIEKLQAISQEIYNKLLNSTILEVSIGAYESRREEQGEWNGETYDYVVEEIIPDHLAILFGMAGACSIDDGCGIRVNREKEVVLSGKKLSILGAVKKRVLSAFTKGLSDIDIKDLLTIAIQPFTDQYTSTEQYISVKAVYDDYFVYEIYENSVYTYYKLGYAIVEGKVILGNNKQQVRKTIEYLPVMNAIGIPRIKPKVGYQEIKKGDIVDKKKVIDDLIKNFELTGYEEEHRPFLEGLTECQLGKIVALVEKAKDHAADLEEPSVVVTASDPEKVDTSTDTSGNIDTKTNNSEKPPVVVTANDPEKVEAAIVNVLSKMTPIDFLNIVPSPIKDTLTTIMANNESKKQLMISSILKVNTAFSKEELEVLDTSVLTKIFQSLPIGNFIGNAGAPSSSDITNNDQFTVMEKVWPDLP